MLTVERVRSLFDYDPATGEFRRRVKMGNQPAGCRPGTTMPNGYLTISVDGRHCLAHRLAWFYVHGEWPHPYIDHIDRDRQNNAIANLRIATQSQNNANMGLPKDNKSGVKGVWWEASRQRWTARIRKDGRIHHLGRFISIEEAAAAYAAASSRMFGEFGGFVGDPPRVPPAIVELF